MGFGARHKRVMEVWVTALLTVARPLTNQAPYIIIPRYRIILYPLATKGKRTFLLSLLLCMVLYYTTVLYCRFVSPTRTPIFIRLLPLTEPKSPYNALPSPDQEYPPC